MASPYVHERQSEYWTSRQVEEFFLDDGFEIITFPLTQYHERRIPTDFIFFDKKHSKLFGFQYKALYGNGKDSWRLDAQQHKVLSRFPWIYYCLSELRSSKDHRVALHLARIKRTDFEYQSELYPDGKERLKLYARWGAFYQGLEKCTYGIKVNSLKELDELLMPEENPEVIHALNGLMADVFITDFASRRGVHLSPQLRQVQTRQE